jgi:hypothetical protein
MNLVPGQVVGKISAEEVKYEKAATECIADCLDMMDVLAKQIRCQENMRARFWNQVFEDLNLDREEMGKERLTLVLVSENGYMGTDLKCGDIMVVEIDLMNRKIATPVIEE